MILFSQGSTETEFTGADLRDALVSSLGQIGDKRRVVAVPPDFTRYHSQSGLLTQLLWEYYGERLTDILPATGTHVPMTGREIKTMFGRVPENLFRIHDWKHGTTMLGEVLIMIMETNQYF